jgi:murein DD-endopeptidase MepM/ murein hydrolase activator NlpD
VRKKHKKKFLNILLIPDDDSTSKSYKVRYSIIRLVVLLSIIFVLLLFFGVFSYSKTFQSALNSQALEKENRLLKNQLSKVSELAAELNILKTYNKRVRNSLEGYVNISGNKGEATDMDLSLDYGNKKVSIFTSYPLYTPVSGFVSQSFNPPVHYGIDIVAAKSTPVMATADGFVIFSGWTVGDGYIIILQHGNGYFSYYKHNQRNLASPNTFVKQGEVIALLGNSGEKSSGPHLHFEIWQNGKPVDPMQFLSGLK